MRIEEGATLPRMSPSRILPHLARLEGQVFLERMVARFTSIQGHPEWKPIYADPRFDLILSYPVIVTPS